MRNLKHIANPDVVLTGRGLMFVLLDAVGMHRATPASSPRVVAFGGCCTTPACLRSMASVPDTGADPCHDIGDLPAGLARRPDAEFDDSVFVDMASNGTVPPPDNRVVDAIRDILASRREVPLQ